MDRVTVFLLCRLELVPKTLSCSPTRTKYPVVVSTCPDAVNYSYAVRINPDSHLIVIGNPPAGGCGNLSCKSVARDWLTPVFGCHVVITSLLAIAVKVKS